MAGGRRVGHHLGRGLGGDLARVLLQPGAPPGGDLPEHQHLGPLRPRGDPRGSGSDDAGGDLRPGGEHLRGAGHEAGLLLREEAQEDEAALPAGGAPVPADRWDLLGAAAVEHDLCPEEQHHRFSSRVPAPLRPRQAAHWLGHRGGHLRFHSGSLQRAAFPPLPLRLEEPEITGVRRHGGQCPRAPDDNPRWEGRKGWQGQSSIRRDVLKTKSL